MPISVRSSIWRRSSSFALATRRFSIRLNCFGFTYIGSSSILSTWFARSLGEGGGGYFFLPRRGGPQKTASPHCEKAELALSTRLTIRPGLV